MIPVNQVILGGGDPLLGTTTIGATIEDQLQFLEKQKQLLETARQRQLQQLPQPAQPQVQQKLIWDEIDNKIIESAINFWFKDDDYKGGSKVWKYFMNM